MVVGCVVYVTESCGRFATVALAMPPSTQASIVWACATMPLLASVPSAHCCTSPGPSGTVYAVLSAGPRKLPYPIVALPLA